MEPGKVLFLKYDEMVAEPAKHVKMLVECWWKSGPKGGRRHNSPLSSLPSFAHSRKVPTSTRARKGDAET
jgi:hypothetical protein